MLYQKEGSKLPKKTSQKLSKFSYYVDTFFPDLFQMKEKTLDLETKVDRPLNQLLSKIGNKNISYNYFYSSCQNSAAINASSILGSVKKLYLNQDVIKINQMSYSRQSIFKQSYLPVYGFFSQIIDFVLIVDKQDKSDNLQKSKNVSKTKAGSKSMSHSNISAGNGHNQNHKTLKTLSKPKEYWLYVIHNCNSFKPSSDDMKKIEWDHFIERYHFTEKNLADPKSKSTISYELVYAHKAGSSLLGFEQNLTRLFIESHCKTLGNQKSLQNMQKLQGHLLQRSSEVQANQQREKDVAFSDEHRRQTKIPIQHFKHYINLKREVYQFYTQLHNCTQEDINKYFYENLICRYLIAKEYHFEQAKKGTLEYLTWEKTMMEKYPSIDSFKQYHQLGAYQYIGEDFMGRPVLLNKAALIDVNKLPDIQGYCDYYIYFLEIYLRSKMRGYVDQMVVLADLSNLGSKNFKLAITKRNLSDSFKYGPERQHGLVVVNANMFAHTAWAIIKPLMPKKTIHKIQISGHNKKEIVDSLISRMDISVIPEYLGGQNKKIDLEFINKTENQEEVEFIQSSKAVSAMARVQNRDEQLQLAQVEMVTTQSAVTQVKASDNKIFSLFQSVTKTFGLRFGD